MTQVISFEDYQPSDRFDSVPWTAAEIYEGDTISGPWTLIDTIALSPVDADPSQPAIRNLTTSNATEADDLWYQIVFVDGSGNVGQPTFPVQNTAGRQIYATIEELARILKADAVKRRTALRRALETASFEIDSELGRDTPFGAPPALATEVCLERAVEHWQQAESPWGIVLGGESATYIAKDSWDRHAHKLVPLKETWGLA